MNKLKNVERRIEELRKGITADKLLNESKEYIESIQEEINILKEKRRELLSKGYR